jgi:hypothetical protein
MPIDHGVGNPDERPGQNRCDWTYECHAKPELVRRESPRDYQSENLTALF